MKENSELKEYMKTEHERKEPEAQYGLDGSD